MHLMVGQISRTSVASQGEGLYVTARITVAEDSLRSAWCRSTPKRVGDDPILSVDTRSFWNGSPGLRPLPLIESAWTAERRFDVSTIE